MRVSDAAPLDPLTGPAAQGSHGASSVPEGYDVAGSCHATATDPNGGGCTGACAAAVLLFVGSAAVQTADHPKCYKIKHANKILAEVDPSSAQFGLETGCKVRKGLQFCVPVTKSVTSLLINKTSVTPQPVYGPPVSGDRICYKVACPKLLTPIADQTVTDQFSTRIVSRFKTTMLSTPAVKGASYCGDGVIDVGEDCDGPSALGACTAGSRSDCTCMCETACCYVEDVLTAAETECFEYSGNPAQVTAFEDACTNIASSPGPVPGSQPFGSLNNGWVPGACTRGPLSGVPCIAGPPGAGNLHVLPSDSTCP